MLIVSSVHNALLKHCLKLAAAIVLISQVIWQTLVIQYKDTQWSWFYSCNEGKHEKEMHDEYNERQVRARRYFEELQLRDKSFLPTYIPTKKTGSCQICIFKLTLSNKIYVLELRPSLDQRS